MFGIETALEIRSKNAIPTKTYSNGSKLFFSLSQRESGRSIENVHFQLIIHFFLSFQFYVALDR